MVSTPPTPSDTIDLVTIRSAASSRWGDYSAVTEL